MRKKILIFGSGYTAQFLKQYVVDEEILETNVRTDQPSTWNDLPSVDGTFWTFPPEPASQISDFLKSSANRLGRVVVIGSTGSLSQKLSRDEGEKLILDHGGVLVRSAGIYGPNRDPRRWIEDGRVGISEKLVNFIHVEDLAQILWAAMRARFQSETFLASDGHPFRWSELIEIWIREFGLKLHPSPKPSKRPSKVVDSTESLKRLKIQLKYPSVLEGVRALK